MKSCWIYMIILMFQTVSMKIRIMGFFRFYFISVKTARTFLLHIYIHIYIFFHHLWYIVSKAWRVLLYFLKFRESSVKSWEWEQRHLHSQHSSVASTAHPICSEAQPCPAQLWGWVSSSQQPHYSLSLSLSGGLILINESRGDL